jgi:hypothetical protein
MAAELPFAQRTRFKMKKIAKPNLKIMPYLLNSKSFKSYPGHATDVIRTFFFHLSPPNTTK